MRGLKKAFSKIKTRLFCVYARIYCEIDARRNGFKDFNDYMRYIDSLPNPCTQEDYDRMWNNLVKELKAKGVWEGDKQNSQE